ncbi:MAG TPA: protein-glutamine glutaminase family protein [Longimicrobium sp.]|nr:protein-glutamine glutaminase family protein [Longimicrobium sp.]
MTEAEAAAIRDSLAVLPAFPANPYSGCHARAEFLFARLAPLSNGKMFKVWLMVDSLMTPVAPSGSIAYQLADGRRTDWAYHVAPAYRDESGHLWVIDRLVSPAPVRVADWLGNFSIQGTATLIDVPGRFYLYNTYALPSARDTSRWHRVLDDFWEYNGNALAEHWAAEDLAVDAVSDAFAGGRFAACELRGLMSQSMSLKERIEASGALPAGCGGVRELYESERARWIGLGL